MNNPADALTIAKRAIELGFTATVGLIHNGHGRLIPLNPEQLSIYREITSLTAAGTRSRTRTTFNETSRTGARTTGSAGPAAAICTISERGLVHWCSQQRGRPGTPLAGSTTEDVRRESTSEKSCAPFCTVSCVHRVALVDRIRTQPIATLDEMMPAGVSGPASVRALRWMFMTGPYHNRFRAVAARLLGSRS